MTSCKIREKEGSVFPDRIVLVNLSGPRGSEYERQAGYSDISAGAVMVLYSFSV